MQTGRPPRLQRICEWALRHRHPLPLVLLGVALCLPALTVGVQSDDIMIRATVRGMHREGLSRPVWQPFTFITGDPAENRKLMELGWMPFWMDPRCRAAFLRPLTAATHMADFRLWDGWPVLMHVQSLAWFAALIWSAAVLYRRFLGRGHAAWVAVLAVLLFAVDDAHGVPAGWLANRNSLLAGLFGVLALLAHDRWRQDGWRPGAVLAPLALLASLLSKEAAVGTCGYLLAYALFLDRGSRAGRAASLVPCVLVTAAWYAVYRGLGFGVAHSGMYIDPGRAPLRFVVRAGVNGPLLLLDQWAGPDSDISNLWSLGALRVHWLAAMAVLAVLGVLLAPLLRRDRLARFWALGMVLSVLPVCAAFPSGRLLMFVGLGSAPLLAQWLSGRRDGAWRPVGRGWNRLAGIAAGFLVFFNLILGPLLLPLKSVSFRLIGGFVDRQFATLPDDEAFRGQTAVFATSLMSLADYIWQIPRNEQGRAVPRRTLQLNASASAASITRTDERTLVVRPEQGYLCPIRGVPGKEGLEPAASPAPLHRLFDVLIRPAYSPMKLGQVVALPDAIVTVTALTEDGRPAEGTFRFERPLEDPSYRWLMLQGRRFVPFVLPAVGETVRVASPLE